MFNGLTDLSTLKTDAYMFCCLKPERVSPDGCTPTADVFSSCDDLMRSDGPRILVWIIGAFALLGNALSLVFRIVFDRARFQIGYGVFVTNLTIADFLMGIYLMIIAGADAVYRRRYIWNEQIWRQSVVCSFAGFLSTISSQASVFFICLITLDRILVIKFPFGRLKFTTRIAVCTCIVFWAVALLMAAIPFMFKSYFGNGFYSSNAVCLALPLTRNRPDGWEYAVSIFIFLNFLTFLLIALGQCFIYQTVKTTRDALTRTRRQNDLLVARNLLLVVATDFLCWCPIGIMGVLAMADIEIPGEVYVWTTVPVLPINSALNPFLYTVSAIIRKKKFSPNVDEQLEDITIDADILEKSFKEGHIYCLNANSLRRLYGQTGLTLDAFLDETHEIEPVRALCILWIITRRVAFLHEMKLYFGHIVPGDIRIDWDKDSGLDAGICIAPSFAKNKNDRPSDIYNLGLLSRNLIRACLGKRVSKEVCDKV